MDLDLNCGSFSFSGISMGIKVSPLKCTNGNVSRVVFNFTMNENV